MPRKSGKDFGISIPLRFFSACTQARAEGKEMHP